MLRVLTALALVLGSTASAQELTLDHTGGVIAGTTSLTVEGQPNRHYWILFDFRETKTDLGGGLELDISLDWLNYSMLLPGFLGDLGSNGRARADFVLPDHPAIDGVTMSLQSCYCSPIDEVSALRRVTPAYAGTFEPTLDAPDAPILSGVAIPRDDGTVQILGETIPLVYEYLSALEEFEVSDLSCSLGALSTQTVMPDGRVLMAGGLSADDGQPSDAAVIYDPATGLCTELTMPGPRAGHAATMTGDGEVLLVGGFETIDLSDLIVFFEGIRDDSLLFDPSTDTFRDGPVMAESKALHTATMTKDGGAIVAGGLTLIDLFGVQVPFVSVTAYKFDDASDDFEVLPSFFSEGRMLHGAALVSNGRVLLAGGLNIDFTDFLESGDPADIKIVAVSSGEVWEDAFFDSWVHVDGLSDGRALPAVIALKKRRVLILGGVDVQLGADLDLVLEPKDSADLYEDLAFTATGSMTEARIDPVVVKLQDGTILVVGGGGLLAETYQTPEN